MDAEQGLRIELSHLPDELRVLGNPKNSSCTPLGRLGGRRDGWCWLKSVTPVFNFLSCVCVLMMGHLAEDSHKEIKASIES
jgi:hypothetical protein